MPSLIYSYAAFPLLYPAPLDSLSYPLALLLRHARLRAYHVDLTYPGILVVKICMVVCLGNFSSFSSFALQLHVGRGLPLFVPAIGGRWLVSLWFHYVCGGAWGGWAVVLTCCGRAPSSAPSLPCTGLWTSGRARKGRWGPCGKRPIPPSAGPRPGAPRRR